MTKDDISKDAKHALDGKKMYTIEVQWVSGKREKFGFESYEFNAGDFSKPIKVIDASSGEEKMTLMMNSNNIEFMRVWEKRID